MWTMAPSARWFFQLLEQLDRCAHAFRNVWQERSLTRTTRTMQRWWRGFVAKFHSRFFAVQWCACVARIEVATLLCLTTGRYPWRKAMFPEIKTVIIIIIIQSKQYTMTILLLECFCAKIVHVSILVCLNHHLSLLWLIIICLFFDPFLCCISCHFWVLILLCQVQ